MGRLPTPATPSPPINHFSHPHVLNPISPHQIPPNTLCNGCKLQSNNTNIVYACLPCNFILHESCTALPKLITHPSHGITGCTLSLFTLAPYPGGSFSCDACTRSGNGWSYHCIRCEYDLHVSCASMPLRMKHPAHATCELELTFKCPYVNANGFSCDICRKMGSSNQWLYRCVSCEFDVHLDCTRAMPQPRLQHQHSLPAAAPTYQYQHGQLLHSASTGGIMMNPNQCIGTPGIMMNPNQCIGTPGIMMNPNQGIGTPGIMMNPNQGIGVGFGGMLVAAAAQGLVGGVFQGIGQAGVQELIGGGAMQDVFGGGGGDGAGGNIDGSSF